MQRADIGFDPANLLSLTVTIHPDRYPDAALRLAIADRIAERVRGVPGVTGVALAAGPPEGAGIMIGSLTVEGQPAPADPREGMVAFNEVDTAWFRILGLPIREGRALSGRTDEVVIDRTTAETNWRAGTAVGGRIRLSERGNWLTVVGVVEDVRPRGMQSRRTSGTFYRPLSVRHEASLLIRTAHPGSDLVPAITRAILAEDENLLIREPGTVVARLERALAPARFNMRLLGAFAGVAFVLAAIGLYGVLAYTVGQRRREMGVRLALGASPAGVQAMVVRQGMALAVVGLVLGLAGAAATTRLMQQLLFGVQPLDAQTFVTAAVMLLATAALACWIPARRAASVDPAMTLRAE